MIRRPPRSTQSRSSAASDVYKRQTVGGASNSDTTTTTVNAQADLRVTKTDGPDPVLAGNTLTYTITVDNLGPSDALGVSLSDVLPTELTGEQYCVTTGVSCSPSTAWTGSVS